MTTKPRMYCVGCEDYFAEGSKGQTRDGHWYCQACIEELDEEMEQDELLAAEDEQHAEDE